MSSATSTVRTWMPSASASLGAHVEVHVVAGIVAIDEEHALAAIDRLDGLVDNVGAGCGKDVAADRGIRPALADKGRVHRLVPGTAADQQRDLVVRHVGPHQGIDALDLLQLAMRGEHQAVDDFGDDVLRIVDDLLDLTHGRPPAFDALFFWLRAPVIEVIEHGVEDDAASMTGKPHERRTSRQAGSA